jgi:hypothetical protein
VTSPPGKEADEKGQQENAKTSKEHVKEMTVRFPSRRAVIVCTVLAMLIVHGRVM